MSLSSWKEEFYPKDADEATGSELEAARHSLKKWEGLTKENLKRHEVTKRGCFIEPVMAAVDSFFIINEGSCALCQLHGSSGRVSLKDCERCCLTQNGQPSCISPGSAYSYWYKNRDPRPLIQLLRTQVERLEEASK